MRCDGKKVARLRQELGISQQDLADKAKLSKTTIERMERGLAVDYQSIHQVAPVLDMAFAEMLRPEQQGAAGPETEFVPLAPLRSSRELMDLLLRCDSCNFDVLDDPDQSPIDEVVGTLQRLEEFIPGSPRVNLKTIDGWRRSAADRLEGLPQLHVCVAELARADLHLLAGEYIAHLDEDEAHAAIQDYVDLLEVSDCGVVPSQPVDRKRVAVLRVAKRSRHIYKLKVEDQFSPQTPSAVETDDMPLF